MARSDAKILAQILRADRVPAAQRFHGGTKPSISPFANPPVIDPYSYQGPAIPWEGYIPEDDAPEPRTKRRNAAPVG
jgi:hypothetical protein